MCKAVGGKKKKKKQRRTKVNKDAQPFHLSSRLSLSSSLFQPGKPTLLSFVLVQSLTSFKGQLPRLHLSWKTLPNLGPADVSPFQIPSMLLSLSSGSTAWFCMTLHWSLALLCRHIFLLYQVVSSLKIYFILSFTCLLSDWYQLPWVGTRYWADMRKMGIFSEEWPLALSSLIPLFSSVSRRKASTASKSSINMDWIRI